MSVSSLYRQLFGRKGPAIGTDIDMAEHGRAGGESVGQAFKFTRSVDEKVLIDEVSETLTYVGKSKLSGNTANTEWQIKRISISGTVTTISYADNSDNYDKEWDERASYTY